MIKSKVKKQPTYNCKPQDIIFDIKTIMPDYYFAEFIEGSKKLKVMFDNGQKFIIKVKACK